MLNLIKAWFCFAFLPLYFGGGGIGNKGPTSTTTNNTSTATTNTDKRLVIGSGSTGVSADNSSVTLTSNTYSTDGGAVKNSLDFANDASRSALDFASEAINKTNTVQRDLIDLQKSGGEQQFKTFQQALGFASDTENNAFSFLGDAARIISNATQGAADSTKAAYQAAADNSSGNRFLIVGGLLIVGVVAFAALKGK